MKVALIGLGRMGRNHLRVLTETPDVEVACIVDATWANADPPRDLDRKHRLFCSVGAIDRSVTVEYDAAIVATPTSTHYDIATELIRRNKHVLVEKPLASTAHEARTLLTLARQHGVKLAVGHLERLNPAVQRLELALRAGEIGRPIHFAFTRAGGYPGSLDDGNNVVFDLAVHDIDVFRMLAGPARVVHAHAHAAVRQALDTAELALRSDGGITANIHVNWNTPTKIRTLRVTGTEGVCFVDYVAQTCEVVRGGVAQTTEFADMRAAYGSAERVALDVTPREPLRVQLEQFREFISGGSSGSLCTGEDALAAVTLAERAMTLSDEGYV